MRTNKFLGSILLVAGTSIGAAMLALPVVTAAYGFIPAIIIFFLSWMVMTVTALLMLEVNLWLKPGANIVTMATTTLGLGGKIVAWVCYLLLFYALMAAYATGMGDVIQKGLLSLFGWSIANWLAALFFIILISIAVYIGTWLVDYTNRLFFFGKLLACAMVILLLLSHIKPGNLEVYSVNKIWLSLAVVITSFGFQNIVPSLRVYLENDVKKIRGAIIIGSLIPLLVYICWQAVIMGVLPLQGENGLLAVLAQGQPATGLSLALNQQIHNPLIITLFRIFTFCAIATSFICVSFSLFDFLIDSFHIPDNRRGRWLTLGITFIPPLVFAFFYPNGFIFALHYGGIFATILLILLPVLMTISGRYWKNIAYGYRVPVGVTAFIIIIIVGIIIMIS